LGVEDDLDAVAADYASLDPALPGRFRSRLLEQVERIELLVAVDVLRDSAWIEATTAERA
jgi:hypothetical protein